MVTTTKEKAIIKKDCEKVKEEDRILIVGMPDFSRCDNTVRTSRYTAWTFLPIAITEQFRRFANLYFLMIGVIQAVGYFTDLFESAINPLTTLGPLAIVVSVSLIVEGCADLKRHVSDEETNSARCVILQRTDELGPGADERDPRILSGRDCVVNMIANDDDHRDDDSSRRDITSSSGADAVVRIAFHKVRRMDIRQGHLVLVRNREMVPADFVLLATSHGSAAYIETSSIDGETNLKLRTAPPPHLLLPTTTKTSTVYNNSSSSNSSLEEGAETTIEDAVQRITRLSYLGHPGGRSALLHPDHASAQHHPKQDDHSEGHQEERETSSIYNKMKSLFGASFNALLQVFSASNAPRNHGPSAPGEGNDGRYRYIAALTTEPPNPSVHTFLGSLTIPLAADGADGSYYDIPLDADNVLLRGAVLRNTEWVIGVAIFTGVDTKLVKNSVRVKSKFSQLDILMNKTVLAVLFIMFFVNLYLAFQAVKQTNGNFEFLFYVGYNRNAQEPWPYLPNLPPPAWVTKSQNILQYFFLYVTLLYNIVPLSMYVTVELVTYFMLWLVYVDLDMYDDTTNTRAQARSSIITDLGRIQYIFSDKTGTLTQNVMRFKRSSVDGLVFGAPIRKKKPRSASESDDDEEEEPTSSSFYPLRQLLVGQLRAPSMEGLVFGSKVSIKMSSANAANPGKLLTFNAEMFLRVMSLCHTVVVEKDIDKKETLDSSGNTPCGPSASSSSEKKPSSPLLGREVDSSSTSDSLPAVLAEVTDNDFDYIDLDKIEHGVQQSLTTTVPTSHLDTSAKGSDGAPVGFAYQAESPDEEALVSAASKTYGFQVVSRDSSGVRLRLASQSHLQNPRVTEGLESGALTLKRLAAETASEMTDDGEAVGAVALDNVLNHDQREETWSILAVNKFDSDRKRMSILLRSPPDLGGLPILFCKGADSSMLHPGICSAAQLLESDDLRAVSDAVGLGDKEKVEAVDEDGWEVAQILGLQAHLGEFAKEGLRTLVLGMRVLSERECSEWLAEYKEATTCIENRAKLLTKVAMKIETKIHIVGATAIEDKLQKNVPETIATLAKAGIKLWVLTGDKRETAVEIGYSTNVLTQKMHVTEVADNGKDHVCAQMAMEFIRLVEMGRLAEYGKDALRDAGDPTFAQKLRKFTFAAGKQRVQDIEKLQHVRACAEKLIDEWMKSRKASENGKIQAAAGSDELSLVSEERPTVFTRASSARSVLEDLKSKGELSQAHLRELSLTALTVNQSGEEDLNRLFPGNKNELRVDFDKKKRTILERLFANDREVRKGQLRKHMHAKSKRQMATIEEHQPSDGPRALVIEGAALKLLLGNPDLEAILFAVASNCDAVIACRSSPKQKAELVNLVRRNVKPEPITLAIGDGANDVGMIQEAHVGVGISGKEGKQAVNASDFSIAQFRFLENLILIHGRWNFYRLSTVVYFSFYKNALMCGILICYASTALYSGTPLFDQWVMAMLNFVAAFPIIILGLFDRFLSKEYVKKNPEVYKATRNNEVMTARTLLRWIALVLIHALTLYYMTVPQQSLGGGMTGAWQGLMKNNFAMAPGNGEGGDLRSVGTVTFTCMIILLAYKVLLESRSLVHGVWPAFVCRKGVGEGFFSRVAYTWQGVAWLSIGFYLFCIGIYGLLGRIGPFGLGAFTDFAGLPMHMLTTRSLSWMLILFVPIIGIAFDVCIKVFANMYFPTQTQIHLEIECQDKSARRQCRALCQKSSFLRSRMMRVEQEQQRGNLEQQQQQHNLEP